LSARRRMAVEGAVPIIGCYEAVKKLDIAVGCAVVLCENML